MTITIESPALVAALNNLAAAISGANRSLAAGFAPTTSAAEAPLPLPNPVVTEKRGRGRPKALVGDGVTDDTAALQAPIDYDAVLTETRQMSVRLLGIDQTNKNTVYKERLRALWIEIDPESAGKLSGISQDKLPAAREALVAIMPAE